MTQSRSRSSSVVLPESRSRSGSALLMLDLLDDTDFEDTMLALEQSERLMLPASPALRRISTRRSSMGALDLCLASLAELFPSNAADQPLALLSDDQAAPAIHAAATTPEHCLSPTDLRIRLPSRSSIKIEPARLQQQPQPQAPQELSPVMDSFLRESWDDISDLTGKNRRSSSKVLEALLQGMPLSVSPMPRPSAKSPGTRSTFGHVLPHSSAYASPRPSQPPAAVRLQTTSSSSSAHSAPSSRTKRKAATTTATGTTTKAPRRAKQCVVEGCVRRAQSNNRCKTHGGGARCQMPGCDKSSQGGGLCRAHGGGKKCRIPGCTKGTQRLGLCYLHGGIRRCLHEGCSKKDRGNGFCISHGGGRRCETPGCERSVRKGNHCQVHQGPTTATATAAVKSSSSSSSSSGVGGSTSPFQISRGHGLQLLQ